MAILALALMNGALRSAGAAALEAWIRQEVPDARLLGEWAAVRRYRRLPQARIPSPVWRSLPSRGASDAPVWISEDEDWLAFYASDPAKAEEGPVLFCVQCLRRPSGWRSLGTGWEGIREFARWAGGPAAAPPPAPRSANPPPRDPREFRY